MADRWDQHLAAKAASALRGPVDDKLRTRLRTLPALIQTSGLAATCAFLLSRAQTGNANDPYLRTARILLTESAVIAGLRSDEDPEQLLAQLAAATPEQYVLCEAVASELARWLSRLAQAQAKTQAAAPAAPNGGS